MTINNTPATQQARSALEALIAECEKEAKSLETLADGMLTKAATLRARQGGLDAALALVVPPVAARVGAPKPPSPPKGVPLDEPEPTPEAKKALADPDTSLIARVWLACRGREIRTLDLVEEMGLPYGNIASAIQGLCRNGYATRVARGRYRFKRYRRGLALR
jgi:hypothetical protein